MCVSVTFIPTFSCKRHRNTFCKTRNRQSRMRKVNPGSGRSGARCCKLTGMWKLSQGLGGWVPVTGHFLFGFLNQGVVANSKYWDKFCLVIRRNLIKSSSWFTVPFCDFLLVHTIIEARELESAIYNVLAEKPALQSSTQEVNIYELEEPQSDGTGCSLLLWSTELNGLDKDPQVISAYYSHTN